MKYQAEQIGDGMRKIFGSIKDVEGVNSKLTLLDNLFDEDTLGSAELLAETISLRPSATSLAALAEMAGFEAEDMKKPSEAKLMITMAKVIRPMLLEAGYKGGKDVTPMMDEFVNGRIKRLEEAMKALKQSSDAQVGDANIRRDAVRLNSVLN